MNNLIKELEKEADVVLNRDTKYRTYSIKNITIGMYVYLMPSICVLESVGDITNIKDFETKIEANFEEYKPHLKKIIETISDATFEDLTTVELLHICIIAVTKMDTTSFQKSTILMKRIGLTNLTELIAADDRCTTLLAQ